MPIEFRCSQCSRLLRTPDDTGGKRAKCPDCGEIMTVPSPQSEPPPPPPSAEEADLQGSPFGGSPNATAAADDRNPYRSPVEFGPTPTGYAAQPGEINPTQIDLGDVLTRTWTIFKDRFGVCLGAFFLAFIINFVVGQTLTQGAAALAATTNEQPVAVALVVLGNGAAQIFSLWITIGQAMIFLRIARGQPVEWAELFAGGPYLLPALGASILFGLIVLAGLVLLVIPGIVFALMFSQYFYLIIDRNAGVIESLDLSRQVTSGNKLTLFALGLVILGLAIVAVLPCGLGLLILWPFVSLLWPLTYLSMTGQPTAEQVQFQYQPA